MHRDHINAYMYRIETNFTASWLVIIFVPFPFHTYIRLVVSFQVLVKNFVEGKFSFRILLVSSMRKEALR